MAAAQYVLVHVFEEVLSRPRKGRRRKASGVWVKRRAIMAADETPLAAGTFDDCAAVHQRMKRGPVHALPPDGREVPLIVAIDDDSDDDAD